MSYVWWIAQLMHVIFPRIMRLGGEVSNSFLSSAEVNNVLYCVELHL